MEIPRHWRLKAQRYRLQGSTCPNCGKFIFPPRPVCSHCTAQLTRIALGNSCYYQHRWVLPTMIRTALESANS